MSSVETKLETIEAAKSELSAAEREIERLLREIPVMVRAEKTRATEAIEGAFSKLHAAQAKLVELENLLRAEAK